MRKRTHSDEEIINAVKQARSYKETLRILRKNKRGGHYDTMRKRIKILNLDVSHFSGKLWSKGKTALDDLRIGKPINEIFCEDSTCSRSYVKSLIISHNLKDYKCSICDSVEWRGKELNLHLDHINGKNHDHRLENLRFLCPNCHSQTITYCTKTQNRYSDESIREASIGCSTINQVMTKLGMSNGTNYKRLKKLLPHLVEKPKQKPVKLPAEYNGSHKSKEWLEKIGMSNRRVVRPSKDELEKLVNEKPMTHIGKQFSVSDNAVRKWCKSYGISTKPNGYWTKQILQNSNFE